MTDYVRSEVRITAVEPTGAPEKRNFPFAISWFAPIRYTLEDGRTVETFDGPYTRKRDAVAGSAARDGITNMTANFHDDRFVGTTTSYRLGG